MISERFLKQIEFIKEIDKLKQIYRQSYILGKNRKENDAEHSWHIALMAILLQEHSNQDINIIKTIKMLLIHDLVEIDAGDTYAYDEKGNEEKFEREQIAAERIFGLLPEDQRQEFLDLWLEFEERKTNEAKFAASLDRFQPIILNYFTDGKAWIEHDIKKEQVIKRNQHTNEGSTQIWEYILEIIDDAVLKEYLKD